ncbi:SGNH/GDSL hydrolase family protein [Xanthobacter dioxanivorans]|uniref:SGNH/GDSL hydrolase family protein n=1 Tax=Xanthobacter dioxanivorans TaxID=2528964 RepID=A0A974PKF4_9HYPH|nr:SGNH/GDSL hydrolase family protein [Xanthobacter dioxanivorans]QRG04846.1 SGNH/GDSL hydrolase family protein [Xanthobacter dioxanivorans]
MTKYYRDFKSSSLRKLQETFSGASGKRPANPASPATITLSAPTASGSGTSQITSKVDHFLPSGNFSVYNGASWTTFFNTGVQYYQPNASNTDKVNMATLAFRYEGSKFELMARSSDSWTIFADGELVIDSPIQIPPAAGYAVVRLTVDFGTRAVRNIVCYGITFGFAGVSVGPTDSIAPIDLAPQVKIATMSDSYGQGTSSNANGGPFAEAALALVSKAEFPLLSFSAGGGSGYITGGTGGNAFLARVPNIVVGSPDLVIVAGGINDSTTGLAAGVSGVLSSIRTALPNAVIATVGVWTPSTSYYGSGLAKHDIILPVLQTISGPWIDVDVTRGAWTNSAGGTGRVGPAPWVTGSGKVGTTTGTGNADFNTSADGVHPYSPDGHDYLAGHLYSALRAGLLDL